MDPLRPGEHHHGVLRDRVAMVDRGVDLDVAARVDLAVSDIALAETAHNPGFQDRVASILPDRERLEQMEAWSTAHVRGRVAWIGDAARSLSWRFAC